MLTVFRTRLNRFRVSNQTEIENTNHLVFYLFFASIEVSGADYELDLNLHAKFFVDLSMNGFRISLFLIKASGHTFPLTAASISI